jgi:hypothetical protein
VTLQNAGCQVIVKGDYSSAIDLANIVASHNVQRGTNFDNGTGAGQADLLWSDTRTLGASASEDLDFAGVLIGAFGAALTFARLKILMISAAPGNTNNVIIGGVASGLATILAPAATGTAIIRPGGLFAVCCGSADATGYVVTPSTGDLLHVANSGAGTGVTYDIVAIGCSV